MASAQKLPSGAWRTRATRVIDGKKVTKSFTADPKDFGGDWRKAKKESERLADNWMADADFEMHTITVRKAIEDYINVELKKTYSTQIKITAIPANEYQAKLAQKVSSSKDSTILTDEDKNNPNKLQLPSTVADSYVNVVEKTILNGDVSHMLPRLNTVSEPYPLGTAENCTAEEMKLASLNRKLVIALYAVNTAVYKVNVADFCIICPAKCKFSVKSALNVGINLARISNRIDV